MNRAFFYSIEVKHLLATLLLFSSAYLLAQQKPFISSLSKTSATVGETVIISGSNFSSDFNDMRVNFGAGKATVVNGSERQLEVLVPNTATYGPVVVTNTSTARSGTSSQHFTLSFGGSAFDPDKLDNQVNYATNNNLTTDLCACDFDGDGRVDVAVSNAQSTLVNIFRNSSGTPPTFTDVTATAINQHPGFETVSNDCADLNGDGKPELVFTALHATAPSHIIIYQNTSAGSIKFTTVASFKLPTLNGAQRNPRTVRFADLDADGKPELIVGNESDNDNKIHIYRNTSSLSTVSFATSSPVEISGGSAFKTGSIEVGDVNNDHLPEILFVPSGINNEFVYVVKNESAPGTIKFDDPLVLQEPGNRANIKLADLNNDGFPEIITAGDLGNRVAVFTNNTGSPGGAPAFTLTDNIAANNALGIGVGDLNGDGKTDVLIASTANTLLYFENNSTNDVILESAVPIATSSAPRNVKIVDFNGDAKPDLLFTHKSLTNTPGELSVIVNRNCLSPTINPAGLTFCTGAANSFTLSATNTLLASYSWSFTPALPAANIVSQNGNEIEIFVDDGVTSIDAAVTITADDGSCTDVATETFTLTGGTDPAPPAISISASGIICSGAEFTLSAHAGQESYLWTLPDGTTSSDQTLTVDSATAANAGIYTLRVQPAGGCFSPENTRTVEVDEPPLVSIVNTGDDHFCEGTSITLEVPVYDGFSYQWKRDGVNTGTGLGTLEVAQSGDFTVTVISDATSCEVEGPVYTVTEVAPPTSNFDAVDEICTEVSTTFTATSTPDPDNTEFSMNYTWDFDDGTTGNDASVSHAFATAGDYDVVLTTAYDDVALCSHAVTIPIQVSDPPTLNISAVGGSFEKCPADSIRLELPQGYQSYAWSTGDDTVFTYAKTGPEEDEVTITADVVTDIGCSVNNIEATVSNYANSRIGITSSEAQIVDDVINLESGISTVALTATDGENYVWEPAELIQVSGSGESITVYPKTRETVVTVTGTDVINGCETSKSVTIITPGVIARKSFSPNGDGMGFDCWEILNSDNLQGCTVYVFDQRGRYVFKGDAPFEDNCVWNGNIDNGSSQAPEGIYYFVMKCENSDFEQTGTILLAR